MKDAFEFLRIGGIVMIPIALGSIIALAIFIERMWALARNKIFPEGLVSQVFELLQKGDINKARDVCLASNSPIGRIFTIGIDAKDISRSEIKERLEEIGHREVARMDRFIEAMGTTASVEPLLGLLGTVIGMIGVFKQVVGTASSGAVDPSQLANGIWQALITTAAGLSVAIFAYIGYRYLLSKSHERALELEEHSLSLLENLSPTETKNNKAKD